MSLIKIEPWSTPSDNMSLDRTITLVFILVTLFVLLSTLFIGGNISDIFRQQTYTLFLLLILIFTNSIMDSRPSIYAGFGSRNNSFTGLAIGGFIGLVVVGISVFNLNIPAFSNISSVEALSIFYTLLVIPFAEEKMFGQTVPFIIKRSLKNSWATIVIASLIFGGFHYFAYFNSASGVEFAMLFAVAFRALVLVGNEMLQTATFGISLHYFNNIAQVAKQIKNIGLI